MEMNGEKTSFISPWRKGFLIFLQRQQSLVLRQSGLIQWSDSFRKRLENIYPVSMARRIENKRFPWDYAVVLRLPIIFRNPLRFHTYKESQIYGDKGITVDRDSIRYYPGAVFQKHTNFIQGGVKSPNYKRLPVVGQRREIFDPMQIHFLYTILPTIFKERIGIISFSRTGRMPVFNQDTIRSMKPYQRTVLRALYGDKRQDRADSGMVGSLISGSGGFRSNMDQIHRDQSKDYFRETEKINSPEFSENLLLRLEGSNLRYEYIGGQQIGRRMGRVSFAHTGWMPVVNQGAIRSMRPYQSMTLRETYGDAHYDRADSGSVKNLISGSGEFRSNMDQIYRDQSRDYFGEAEKINSPEVSENLLLKPESLNLKYKGYKRKITGRTGRASLTHTRQILMVNQYAIRSMKPYKRAALKSVRGDMTHGDMQYERTNSGIVRNLTSDSGEFSSSMDQIHRDQRRDYFGGGENLNPPEASDTIRPFNHDGLKPFQQKHLPGAPFRHERIDSMQADTIYAIPPWTQAESKRAGGRFNSILTSDKTREFSRPLSLNAEREMSLYKITQTENPFWEKKETGKTGSSIDYNKVADRVYEILTRRIIREKERMGELI